MIETEQIQTNSYYLIVIKVVIEFQLGLFADFVDIENPIFFISFFWNKSTIGSISMKCFLWSKLTSVIDKEHSTNWRFLFKHSAAAHGGAFSFCALLFVVFCINFKRPFFSLLLWSPNLKANAEHCDNSSCLFNSIQLREMLILKCGCVSRRRRRGFCFW